jgi:hypothetical protein
MNMHPTRQHILITVTEILGSRDIKKAAARKEKGISPWVEEYWSGMKGIESKLN